MQKLINLARKAITDYNMIADGDKIAVGISGGKDSIALLAALQSYQKFSPQKFELTAINIDMGFKETDQNQVQALKDYCAKEDIPLIIHNSNLAEILFDIRKEKNPCSLCSKIRRGALNTVAIEQGCNKLALGHHADDVIETMFMSLFYEGRFNTFAPVSYMSRTDITLIRPFIYAEEKYITSAVRRNNLPIVHNPCPKDKSSVRSEIKQFIADLDYNKRGTKNLVMQAVFNPERNNLWDKSLPDAYKKVLNSVLDVETDKSIDIAGSDLV